MRVDTLCTLDDDSIWHFIDTKCMRTYVISYVHCLGIAISLCVNRQWFVCCFFLYSFNKYVHEPLL